jgi:glycosyltransferase involved in cell wall biosynthesis
MNSNRTKLKFRSAIEGHDLIKTASLPCILNSENDQLNYVPSLVSVIMPAFNCAETIERAVTSVLNQIYSNFELIIINDCSQDNTLQIIRKLSTKDSRILALSTERNEGPASARNTGIRSAKGEFIAFLDADDYWLTNKLSVQIPAMSRERAAISFSSYYHCDISGRILKQIRVPATVSKESILYRCPIGCLTAIYSTKLVGKVYMPIIPNREDYVTWIKVLEKNSVNIGIDEPLACYTVRRGSISSNKLKSSRWQWIVYRHILKLSTPRSIWYFCAYAVNGMLKHYA